MTARNTHASTDATAKQHAAACLRNWNDTTVAWPRDRLIHQYIEDYVCQTPGAVAVVSAGRSLTYGELNGRANQLAHYLRSQAVAPDDVVGLCVERGLDMIVALLGIFKAGGAYLPLDPTYPADLLAYMLEDAAPRTVLIQERFRHLLPATYSGVISLDCQSEVIAAHASEDIVPSSLGLAPNHLAYVIYTSGSTGRPKGVMVEHRNVVNLWRALERDIYSHHPHCRTVAVNASLAFDSSVKQLVQLLSGRTLFPVPQAVRMDAAEFLSFIDKHCIDSLDCTPTQLGALVAAGLLRQGRRAPLLMLLGGEHVDETLWCRLAESTQPVFYNVYGPTECTVDATIARVSASRTPTIGRPIANGRIYVLDACREPAAVGVEGEIYIGGAGVGRGYLHRAELTAERFVHDPFVAHAAARMYKTGDLGRWRTDGCVEYLGRNDEQVKIRGFRIEVAEIEAQLRRDVRVAEAVVAAREDVPGDKRLVGYVVPVPALSPPTRELVAQLHERLRQNLPQHMVPAIIVLLERLPVSANGKVDRRKLPAPPTELQMEQSYAAPTTPIESRLCAIWQEVFSAERIGVNDSFFDLGGHSMVAMRLSVAISEGCGVGLPFAAVFEYPTIRQMAPLVERLLVDSPEMEEGAL